MDQLYKIPKKGRVDAFQELPFQDENDLQQLILKHPQILGKSVEIVDSKYGLTGHVGEIDILALDRTSETTKLLIVEVKKDADSKVIGQLLDYAEWVISNPTIIRMKVKEKRRVELSEVQIQRPRLIVAASRIPNKISNLAHYIHGFDWDIIEVRQFPNLGQWFTVVRHVLPIEDSPKDPCWELYRVREYTEEQIDVGKKVLDSIQNLVEQKCWKLNGPEQVLNDRSSYGEWVFKKEKKLIFGMGPKLETHGWYLWFELPKRSKARKVGKDIRLGEWYERWFYIDIPVPFVGLSEFERLFTAAYRYATLRK